MPFIRTTTNQKVTQEQKDRIKLGFGEAISLLGKSENWLMVSFDEEKTMYFQGDGDAPMAFVEIQLFGKAQDSAYDNMTQAVTDLVAEQLSIRPDHIYVKYEEVSHWGWNGNNF